MKHTPGKNFTSNLNLCKKIINVLIIIINVEKVIVLTFTDVYFWYVVI